jgi:hypothetical protein
MRKILIASLAVGASLLAAGAAQASNVHWSIGINLPPVGTVISNAPVYAPVPVYAPPPVVYAPAPVIYQPAPRVVYRPAPVVYGPPAYVGRPVPIVYHGGGDRDHDGIPNRYDRYDNRRHWDRDHDGVPNRYDRHDDRKYRH